MSGGLAVVSMVRDEADVIELFVRLNARCADHLYIVDHDSRDGTRELLLRLRAEGLPCTLLRQEGEFQQAAVLNTLLRQLAGQGYDYIVPLDADEFLPLPRQALLERLQRLPAEQCAWLPWKNHGPVSTGWFDARAPLFEVMRPVAQEAQARYKVVVPGAWAARAILSEGSHLVRLEGDTQWRQGLVLPDLPLLHAPVRSTAQIAAKALIGSMTLALKSNRLHQEGGHWDTLAARVVAGNYRLELAEMQQMLSVYTGHEQAPALDANAPGIGEAGDSLRWPELARSSLQARLHQYAQRLVEQLRAAPAA